MYEGAARVHFISAGKCKKSEMLYITWLNIVFVIPFITVAKSKMYWHGVKSTALRCIRSVLNQFSLLPVNTFYFLQL